MTSLSVRSVRNILAFVCVRDVDYFMYVSSALINFAKNNTTHYENMRGTIANQNNVTI